MKTPVKYLSSFPLSELSFLEILLFLEEAVDTHTLVRYSVLDSGKLLRAFQHHSEKHYFEQFNVFSTDSRLLLWIFQWVEDVGARRVSSVRILDQLLVLSEENKYRVMWLGDDVSLLRKVRETIGGRIDLEVVDGHSPDRDIADVVSRFNPDLVLLDLSRVRHESRTKQLFSSLENVSLVVDVGGATKKWWTRAQHGGVGTSDLWDLYLKWIAPNSGVENIQGFDLSR